VEIAEKWEGEWKADCGQTPHNCSRKIPYKLQPFIAGYCYASANIKALETLGYAEHICNYVVILDSWFYGKKSVIGTPSNSGLILEDITSLAEMQIISINQQSGDI